MSAVPNRTTAGWRPETRAYLADITAVLDALREHWPLTLRQLFYQAVSRQKIDNSLAEYKRLSRLLSKARIQGLVPWEAIEDRTRSTLASGGWVDKADFLAGQTKTFLLGYRRDLMASQSCTVEVWVEKDALSRLVHGAAFDYCVPVFVAKGFASVTYKREAAERITASARAGKRTRILYFGDMDPSGWEMLPAMCRTLVDEMDVPEWMFEPIRCALNPDQIRDLALPTSIEAIKRTDTRARKYIDRFGLLAVELDALSPAQLQTIVRQSIEATLSDPDRFAQERDREAADLEAIAGLRAQALGFIDGLLGGEADQ